MFTLFSTYQIQFNSDLKHCLGPILPVFFARMCQKTGKHWDLCPSHSRVPGTPLINESYLPPIT